MNLPDELLLTLSAIAQALSQAHRPWWIISGAACALHGIATGPTRDVDVLVDRAGIGPLLATLNLMPSANLPHGLFRSKVFASWSANPLEVEFFAEFAVRKAAGW